MRRAVFVSRRLFQALGPTVAELGAVNEALCDDDKLEQNTLLGRDTMVSLGTVQKMTLSVPTSSSYHLKA